MKVQKSSGSPDKLEKLGAGGASPSSGEEESQRKPRRKKNYCYTLCVTPLKASIKWMNDALLKIDGMLFLLIHTCTRFQPLRVCI
jgi:hypothetical protein